jgi:hypothetical protein
MECKLQTVHVRRESDSGRVFQLAFTVAENSNDMFRSIIVVIMISSE